MAKRVAFLLDDRPEPAAVHVVVHETHGLHERVNGGWADERPAPALEVFAHRFRFIGYAHVHQGRPIELPRTRSRVGLERPNVGGETAVLLEEGQAPPGVVYRRFDLAAVPNDPRVEQEALHGSRRETRDRLDVEAFERAAEVLSLAEDRQPAEPRLKALEVEHLEESPVVVRRSPPLVVVVPAVQRILSAPPASRNTVIADLESILGDIHGVHPTLSMRSYRSADMGIRVGSTVLNVSDIERGVIFWTGALGYVLRDPEAEHRDFAVLCRGDRAWSNVSL